MPLPSVPVVLRMLTIFCRSDEVMLCSTTPVLLVTWLKVARPLRKNGEPD